YPEGFSAASFVESPSWVAPQVGVAPPGLMPTRDANVVDVAEAPVTITQRSAGDYVVDFGRTWVGGVRLSVNGTAGSIITVQMSEELNSDGTAKYQLRTGNVYQDGFVTRDGQQTLQQWGYRVFRYVEILNSPQPITAANVAAVALRYPFDTAAASLTSSNSGLNTVWTFCRKSIESLDMDLLMDGPTRERAPYEADVYDAMVAHEYLDADPTLARLSMEWLIARPTWPTEWKLYSVMAAYDYWMATGDTSWLATNYAALAAKLPPPEYYDAQGLVDKPVTSSMGTDIVDWPTRDGYVFTNVNTVVNSFTYRALRDLAAIAIAVGQGGDATADNNRADTLQLAINSNLFDSTVGKYRDGLGTGAATHYAEQASVFPVALGVATSAQAGPAVAYLASRGMGGTAALSPYAAPFLLQALLDNGHADDAVALLTSSSTTSWLHMIALGAGSTMESWDPSIKSNTTFSHPYSASPVSVIGRSLFGIAPSSPGYATFSVAPSLGSLTNETLTMPTLRGPIAITARVSGAITTLTLTVPANTTAQVQLLVANQAQTTLRLDGATTSATRDSTGNRLALWVGPGTHTIGTG
ncbi:MAG: alpha-L-rhamnosidase, partial [Pseudonocardiales bacterium]|nr:alpha-L-rhamnosidase [Pseudonocardiales bacterium]